MKATTRLTTALAAVAVLAACHPLGPAKRTTYALHQAVQLTGDGLGRLALAEHEKCLKAHGARTEDYKRCVWPWYGHLDRWHSAGRLGARAALTLMYGGVRVADAAGKKDLDYMELGRPVACALLRTLRIFGHLLQDQGGGVLKLLAAFDPSACPVLAAGPSAAGGAVVVGIGLAVELLALLKRTMIDPADDLFRAVDAWLRAPPKDASDAAAATIRDHLPRAPRAAPRP